VVVVYKVDRLSRSLLDFARVMDRFNRAGAAFVSVTQNFSTADAMGRLTLNMLMSFAEFEREMIGERTRDKIAMSRRKGKWTGGQVPFGYVAKDKRLVPHELESLVVRDAFELLLPHRQTALVARLLNEQQKLLTRVEGKARELVEQRLGVETQRLAAAERQLSDAARALADLANTATEVQHVIGALRDFSIVWEAMTTPNRGRLLHALLDRVVVEETSGRVDIHLVDFAADPDAPATASATSKEDVPPTWRACWPWPTTSTPPSSGAWWPTRPPSRASWG